MTYRIAGGVVTLAGAVENPVGESVSYSWTASAGNPQTVILSGDDTKTPSFDVPFGMNEGNYEFLLSASDGVSTSTDSIVVSIDYSETILPSDLSTEDFFGISVSLSH